MPKKYEGYSLTPQSRADLRGIWLYGAEEWSVETANACYDQLMPGIRDLCAGLKTGRDMSVLIEGSYRIRVGSHHIYYVEEGNTIKIFRILHERMNPGIHLNLNID